MGEFITSGDRFPEDPSGETVLQITDSETKGISETRARIAAELDVRSAERRSMLSYLVATGEHDPFSEALRTLLAPRLSAGRPDMLDAYVDVTVDLTREELMTSLGGER